MEKYFVIHNGDGDTYVHQYTKEELLKAIEDGEFGEGIHDKFPKNSDTNYWDGKVLIIKGEAVSPKPVTVITKFEID